MFEISLTIHGRPNLKLRALAIVWTAPALGLLFTANMNVDLQSRAEVCVQELCILELVEALTTKERDDPKAPHQVRVDFDKCTGCGISCPSSTLVTDSDHSEKHVFSASAGGLPLLCFACWHYGPQRDADPDPQLKFPDSAQEANDAFWQEVEKVDGKHRRLDEGAFFRIVQAQAFWKLNGDPVATKHVAAVIIMSFLMQRNSEEQAAFLDSIIRGTCNLEKAADDPMLAAKLNNFYHKRTWPGNLSEIMCLSEGGFLCRRKDCGFIGPSLSWIMQAEDSYHYCCPDCGQRYRPWRKSHGSEMFMPAQGVLMFGLFDSQRHTYRRPNLQGQSHFLFHLTMFSEPRDHALDGIFEVTMGIASLHDHWCNCLCHF
jgi:Pyruvate/2-oxoacid:ferredoxin oxidoreductase delta subunit